MFDLPIKSLLKPKKLLLAPPDLLVSEAAQRMASKNTGAVLVVDKQGHLLGIFTERDAVFRVLAAGLDASCTPLHRVMTESPATLAPDKSYGHALLLMQERGFRHVPVLERGRVLGIVCARNAMDPELEEFVSETRRREHYRTMVSELANH